MTTMLETLNETLAAYTSETRAVDEKGMCRFLTNDGRMCALGRCMREPRKFAVMEDFDFNLRPEYRGYPIGFWAALRTLHDTACFWNDKGLLADGVYHIETHPVLSPVKHGRKLP